MTGVGLHPVDQSKLARSEPVKEFKCFTWWSGDDIMCWDPLALRVERWKQTSVDDGQAGSFRCVEAWYMTNVLPG